MAANSDSPIISLRRVIRDPETGEEKRDLFWERMGVESGDPEAMIQMAIAYLNGDGVPQSNEKAAELMTMAAELDDPNAQYSLAMFYGQGCGVERSFEKVRYWMTRAEENGDEDAPRILAAIRDAETIQAAADAGNPEAQGQYARIISHFHSPQNFRDAFTYALKSAEGGDLEGMFVLGLAYEHGRGTQQDYEAAFHWYEKAALAGCAPAQTNLACLYGRGDGVAQDQETAMQWLHKAADQREPNALRILGIPSDDEDEEIEEEEDVNIDEILDAIEGGDPNAMKQYAMACLQELDWVEHEPEYGLELLKKVGKDGDIESYALLGLIYENAVGVERDIVEAAKWYELAAASGEPEFEVALAKVCLQELDGKELDLEKCLYYAKSAADKGHPEGASLYNFVSCMQALRKKGILTGDEDADEIGAKMRQAAMDGDEDALKLFG